MSNCGWCAEELSSRRRLEPGEPRECPHCDHVFKGNGWDGIDAHWKAKHENETATYKSSGTASRNARDTADNSIPNRRAGFL